MQSRRSNINSLTTTWLLINTMSNSLLWTLTGDQGAAGDQQRDGQWTILTSFVELPEFNFKSSFESSPNLQDPTTFLNLYQFPLVTMLMLPQVTQSLGSEREERLRQMMRLEGVMMAPYWIGTRAREKRI